MTGGVENDWRGREGGRLQRWQIPGVENDWRGRE
jgi:hypothetical protein